MNREELKVGGEYIRLSRVARIEFIGMYNVFISYKNIAHARYEFERSMSIIDFLKDYCPIDSDPEPETVRLYECVDNCGVLRLYEKNGFYPMLEEKRFHTTICAFALQRKTGREFDLVMGDTWTIRPVGGEG